MRVKICGITRPEDAELACDLGAWAIGLNLWPESPRHAHPGEAAAIAAAFRRRTLITGVFVNPSLREVTDAVENLNLAMVQLHGDEGAAFCREVSRRAGVKVIKALRVRSGADVQAAEAYRTDFHLFDAYSPKRGGSGESFDWHLARLRRSKVPTILAGGLTPENVDAAIAEAQPYAVDVASGVENDRPGVKSEAKMREFFDRANAAGALFDRPDRVEPDEEREVITQGRSTTEREDAQRARISRAIAERDREPEAEEVAE
ncbi:phosphoribosylanthranilate isomerase [Thermoleophilia bacterium SCSIO 60948]|nr:phosphoribosylanthranilate isomerase [Thermoleophilia bacterium SCSIO 60948]